MLHRLLLVLGLIGVVISLWPPVTTLYDLTGEETLLGQLRGLSHWGLTAIRPQPQLAPDALIEHSDVPTTGINTFLQWEVEEFKREETLRILNEAGFQFIRQEFTWEDIEIHGKGDFNDNRNVNSIGTVSAWAKYDNIVDLAEEYNIEIIARLSNPPAWSRVMTNTIGTFAPPDDFTDYGDFVEATVRRYKGRINYYQLWNEPNIYPEWGEQRADPEMFTELLCEGYHRAKIVDPDVVILSPALAQTHGTADGYNVNELVYLTRMYEAGAENCFDILSVQAYGLYSGPTDRRLQPTRINVQRLLFYRDILVRNNDENKSIWISEAGWNSLPIDWPEFAQYGRVDEATKGRYAAEFLTRSTQEWPWVGVVNLWYLKRHAVESDQSYYFRFMEPDFTPLESWNVFRANIESIPSEYTQDGIWLGRPILFILSLGLLFFASLQILMLDSLPAATELQNDDFKS